MKVLRIIVTILLFMMFAGFSAYAGGNREVPVIPPVSSGTQYISPNNDDVQDTAVLKFTVRIYVKSDEGYVPEYGLKIVGQDGTIVKEIKETEESDVNWFFSLFRGYTEFELSKEVSWDGKDETGTVVADGVYEVTAYVVDSSENKTEIPVDDYIVDTKNPDVTVVAPEVLILSPNGDGNLDTLSISHKDASDEVKWTGLLSDADGKAVKEFEWTDGTPSNIIWDGKDDSGEKSPAGTYSYSLSCTDLAGNEFAGYKLDGIILDKTETKVEIVADGYYISPNNDDVQDEMVFYLDESIKTGIKKWWWAIRGTDNVLYWNEQGEGTPPETVTFNGSDSSGTLMPERVYEFRYTVEYENGNKPQAVETVTIDYSPPVIRSAVTNYIFSPNGDNRKENTEIRFQSNEKVVWEGSILNSSGIEVVGTGAESSSSIILWDGSDAALLPAPDGEYTVIGMFQDLAGNRTWSEPISLVIDTEPVTAALTVPGSFSPNSDDIKDTASIFVKANKYDDVAIWTMDFKDAKGETVRTFTGSDLMPGEIEWIGDAYTNINEDGNAVDGWYTAELSVTYLKGDIAETKSDRFYLDLLPPEIKMAVTTDPFSKVDGGIEGEAFITLNIEDNTSVDTWTIDILNDSNEIVRSYSGIGNPSGDITWKGSMEDDLDPPSEEIYMLILNVADSGGNETIFMKPVPLDIFTIKRNGKYYIIVPNIIFGAYKYALDSKSPEMFLRNTESLKRVVNIYNKYSEYGVGLEAHALNIFPSNPERYAKEENVLVPLTENRAGAVKDALINLGLNEKRIDLEWFGGEYPVAPVDDLDVRWKNRRVEFIMTGKVDE